MVKNLQSLGQEDPLEEEMATHSSILAWEIPQQTSLVGYSPWGCKELDSTQHTRRAGCRYVVLFPSFYCSNFYYRNFLENTPDQYIEIFPA